MIPPRPIAIQAQLLRVRNGKRTKSTTRELFFNQIDLRCPPEQLSAEDAAALKEPGPVIEQIKNEAAANKK
jgi:hypothetical protein